MKKRRKGMIKMVAGGGQKTRVRKRRSPARYQELLAFVVCAWKIICIQKYSKEENKQLGL